MKGSAPRSFRAELQQSPRDKPGCKLRVLLNDGSAYVFEFTGSDPHRDREALAAAFAARDASAAPAAAATTIAAARTGSGPVPVAAATTGFAGGPTERLGGAAPSSNDLLARMLGSLATGVGAAANAVFVAADVAQLKRQCLEADPELASKYASVVATGAVSDAEFWQAHAHALLDAATAHGRVGLPSERPDTLRADGNADGKATYLLNARRKVAIFVKEVRVYDAFVR